MIKNTDTWSDYGADMDQSVLERLLELSISGSMINDLLLTNKTIILIPLNAAWRGESVNSYSAGGRL